MKLCIITPTYLPHIGGVEIVTSYLAHGLAVAGHEVHIVTIAGIGSQNNPEYSNGVFIHRIKFPFNSVIYQRRTLKVLAFLIYAFPVVIRIRPDIVHAQNFVPAVTAYISKVILKIPYSICVHTEKFGLSGYGLVLPRILRKYWAHLPHIRHADTIVALTDSTAEEIRKYFKREPKTIPNGIDLTIFKSDRKLDNESIFIPKIACISRLESNKGIECGLEALSLIISKIPQAQLMIIGEGSLRKSLEELTDRLEIRKNVKFLGRVTNSDIPSKLANANIYLLPSYIEGFSLSILEAMACGLPIISTPVGIAPTIQGKWKNGYLVPINDPQAIFNAVMQLAENPAEREEFSFNSIQGVKEYSWDNIINRYEDEFKRIICPDTD